MYYIRPPPPHTAYPTRTGKKEESTHATNPICPDRQTDSGELCGSHHAVGTGYDGQRDRHHHGHQQELHH